MPAAGGAQGEDGAQTHGGTRGRGGRDVAPVTDESGGHEQKATRDCSNVAPLSVPALSNNYWLQTNV